MLSDGQLAQLYISGRPEAANTLVDRYKLQLYRFCNHLAGSREAADDLFQDTWMKAFKSIVHYDCSKQFSTWLFSIAVNTYRDSYRKAKRWLNRITNIFPGDDGDGFEAVPSPQCPVDEQIGDNEEMQHLKKCMNLLNDSFRVPLVLYYVKEQSYEQISEILNIPIGTVKSRLNAAKVKLRKQMEVMGYG